MNHGRPRVFGAVVNNIWSIGNPPGNSDRTNQLFLNPFVNYHFAEDGPAARRRRSRRTGSRGAGKGPSRSAAALARRFTSADKP
jgi:hypothetical protein